MKILVDGRALAAGSARMRLAAAGLALRGHAVAWTGPAPPDGPARGAVQRVALLPHAARHPDDVVIGTDRSVVRSALAGVVARARALAIDLEPQHAARWPAASRWAWQLLYGVALIDPAHAEGASLTLGEALQERIGLWPDAAPPAAPAAEHPDVEVLERACERALARQRGHVPRPAAFLDRDGTLIREREYLADPGGVELLPGVVEGLRALAAAGYALVVISNQSGVGRGLFGADAVHRTMARMRALLRVHGVELDAIYFCPHRPDAGCACRKPGTGLIERAAEDLLLAPARSVMIGDKRLDAETGRRAGGGGILLRTGYAGGEADAFSGAPPDHVADDLRSAAAWVIERGERLPV